MSDPAYEPLVDQVEDEATGAEQPRTWKRFSRFEYGIFFLLGVAMLWAWYEISSITAGGLIKRLVPYI